MLKKILNLSENVTHARLNEICVVNGATVFSKVRVADVLPIDNSGIDDREYRYALQSHFDFVVSNSETEPQFAVEFDGPTHLSAEQKARDLIKDKLCRKFGLPLLRITSNFLTKTYRDMDLLGWFVDVWFMRENFNLAQESGAIPDDEVFDPLAIIATTTKGGHFPYWLAAPIHVKLRKLHNEGKCSSPYCYHMIGVDNEGDYQGLGWLHVSDSFAVSATIYVRSQNFPVVMSELLSDLLVYELYESFTAYKISQQGGVPLENLNKSISDFKHNYTMASAFTSGSIDDY